MSRKLLVTLEIVLSSMTDAQLAEAGWGSYGDDDDDQPPTSHDYDAGEVAGLLPFVLSSEDVVAEMFAGSDIFLNVDGVAVRSSEWGAPQ